MLFDRKVKYSLKRNRVWILFFNSTIHR